MYGKKIMEFDNVYDALDMAARKFNAKNDKYLPFGFLDEYILEFVK